MEEEDSDQSFYDRRQDVRQNNDGYSMSPFQMQGLKIKCEDKRYDLDDATLPKKKKRHHHYDPDDNGSDLELGQIKRAAKTSVNSRSNGALNCSDDDEEEEDENSNDSYDSQEELKLRMKRSVADYASAVQSNVSRLTAANMAALSLAQMGQPLHIPQIPPSLAMYYHPMDLRFYSSQPQVSASSLPSLAPSLPPSLPPSSSSPPTPTPAHPLSHGRPAQPSPSALLEASSRLLASPSSLHQPLQHQPLDQHHQHQQPPQQLGQSARHLGPEPRKRRTRVFIDPLSEIPKLEKWFKEDTHPSAFMIDKFCEELNRCEYRHKFPKLEPKNVQLWFKNHRAKVKRMKVSFGCKYEDDDDEKFGADNGPGSEDLSINCKYDLDGDGEGDSRHEEDDLKHQNYELQ